MIMLVKFKVRFNLFPLGYTLFLFFPPSLHRYVISTLELMVAEDYMIVYLNGATPRRRMPGFTWLKKCYHMIDRR